MPKIELIQGDCLEEMKKFEPDCIDLTVTSPPYDNLRTYNNTLVWGEHVWKPVIQELFRLTKQGGVVVWVVGDATIKGSETGTSFKQALYAKEIGFNLHDTMIWKKSNAFNFGSNNCYKQDFEYMFVFVKGKIKTKNLIKDVPAKMAGKVLKGGRKHANGIRDNVPDFKCAKYKKRSNIWGVSVGGNNYNHPAVFPLQLASNHIISWSNENDTVLDCFMGSGTTGVACKNLNRNFIGIELDPEYFKIAEKRINENL